MFIKVAPYDFEYYRDTLQLHLYNSYKRKENNYMTIKSFFVGLLIAFIVYELLSITIGVIKRKRELKKINESEVNENDVSKEDINKD